MTTYEQRAAEKGQSGRASNQIRKFHSCQETSVSADSTDAHTAQHILDCYCCHLTRTTSDLLHRKYPISKLEIGNADPSASLTSIDFFTLSVIDDTNLLTARASILPTILIDYISNCKMLIVNQFERITECHACTWV